MAERRFQPFAEGEMTPEQQRIAHDIVNGPRQHALRGPFIALLRSPGYCDAAQKLGSYVRYGSILPSQLRELAIIITARHWNQSYVFHSHSNLGIKAGLSNALCEAIAEGRRPAPMSPDETIVYDFGTELLATQYVGDAAFNALKSRFGEQGIIDTIGTIGHYTTICMTLNVDRHPLGDAKPLPVLKK